MWKANAIFCSKPQNISLEDITAALNKWGRNLSPNKKCSSCHHKNINKTLQRQTRKIKKSFIIYNSGCVYQVFAHIRQSGNKLSLL